MIADLPTLFLSFVAYSFLGWVCETVYCSIGAGRFINRGFLTGPVCPVYGFGAMIVLTLLYPVRENVVLVFLLGMIVTSIVEYITAWLLETLFHAKWWDYSHYRFNIHGRVCLLNSLMFGGLSVIAVKVVDPPIQRLIALLPPWVQWCLTAVIGGYFIVDTVVTSRSILALNGKLSELEDIAQEAKARLASYRAASSKRYQKYLPDQERMEELRQRLEMKLADLLPDWDDMVDHFQDKLNNTEELEDAIQAALERLEARIDALESRRSRIHERLMRAFPSMRSDRYPHTIEALRAQMEQRRKNRKEK